MTTLPRRPWRAWAADGAAWALVLAGLCLVGGDSAADGPAVAFIGIWTGIVTVASTLWKIGSTAVTVAVKYAIVGLRWAVNNLTRLIVSGLKKSAVFLARNVQTLGRFLRNGFVALVRNVQRAALWLKGTLTHIFRPVLQFLDRVKGYIRRIYDRFIKPVLDVIEIMRRVFRLLGYLGIDWARALDRKLGQLENLITLPFEWVVGKINELIGVINRIVTADGLLQRLVLINSLLRDYPMTTNMWWNGQIRPLHDYEAARYSKRPLQVPTDQAIRDLDQHLTTRDADVSPLIDEVAASIRLTLSRRGR